MIPISNIQAEEIIIICRNKKGRLIELTMSDPHFHERICEVTQEMFDYMIEQEIIGE